MCTKFFLNCKRVPGGANNNILGAVNKTTVSQPFLAESRVEMQNNGHQTHFIVVK